MADLAKEWEQATVVSSKEWDEASPVAVAEPYPISPVEGASPYSIGQMPTKEETYPYVRGGAQIAAGAALAPTGSPAAMGAGATLAGMGVDAAYGKIATPGEYGTEAALQVGLPGAIEGGWKVAKPYVLSAANKLARRLYQSGAKFFPSLSSEARGRITDTALRDRLLPQDPKSIERLTSKINAIDDATEQAIAAKGMAGEGIPMGGVKAAKDRMVAYYRNSGIFSPEVAEQLGGKLAYVDDLPAYVTPQKALEFRRKMNRDLSGFFGNLQKQGYSINENAMTMTTTKMRGEMNEAIYESIPELKALGKRESDLILLNKHIERTLNRLNNRDIIPLSALIAGSAAGGLVGGISGDWKEGGIGGLGTAAAIMLLGSPNTKARVAFLLARAGGLSTASESTLQLLNLTRKAAQSLEPRMKALPFPRTMGTGKADPSGIIKGGQEIVHAEESNAYEKAWRQYANRNEGQFEITPKSPRLIDHAPMPNEYGSPGPLPKMLADPGRFRNPPAEPYGGSVTSRARAIVDSVELGQMHPILAARELQGMANDALVKGNTYAAETYRKMAKGLIK